MSQTTDDRKKQLDEEREKLFEKLEGYGKYPSSNGGNGEGSNLDPNSDTSLKKLDYDLETDDELLKIAEDSIFADKKREENSLKSAVETALKNKAEKKEETVKTASEDKARNEADYKMALKNVEDQALRRGIARSSIAVGEIADLENAKLSAIREIDRNARERIEEIDGEIQTLNSDFAKKLAESDEKYSKAIAVKLKTLKDERDEKLAEMIRYNNTVNEKIQEGKRGEVVTTPEEFDPSVADLKKLSLVVSYYSAFESPKEALADFLSDPKYHDYLGKYYANVYKILTNKANLEN